MVKKKKALLHLNIPDSDIQLITLHVFGHIWRRKKKVIPLSSCKFTYCLKSNTYDKTAKVTRVMARQKMEIEQPT